MHKNNIEAWKRMVGNAQKSLEGDEPYAEDALIIRVDVWIEKLQAEIRSLKYAEDIRLSRSMSREASEALVKEQIDNEITMKGNV